MNIEDKIKELFAGIEGLEAVYVGKWHGTIMVRSMASKFETPTYRGIGRAEMKLAKAFPCQGFAFQLRPFQEINGETVDRII